MDITSSGQSGFDSDPMVEHSRYPNGNNVDNTLGNGMYIGTGNGSQPENSSDSNSQTINKGLHVHCPDYFSSSIPRDPSAFTPINQKIAMPSPLSPQRYKPPYAAANDQLVVPPKRPPQPKRV